VAIGGDDVLHWAIFTFRRLHRGFRGGPAKAMLDEAAFKIITSRLDRIFQPLRASADTHNYLFEFYALDQNWTRARRNRADLLKAMTGSHSRQKGLFGLFINKEPSSTSGMPFFTPM